MIPKSGYRFSEKDHAPTLAGSFRRDRLRRLRHGLALFLGGSLRDDAERLGVLEVAPERELPVALEQVGRQDGLARARRHLRVHAVETVEAELGVEGRRVVLHLGKIVGERFLAEEL